MKLRSYLAWALSLWIGASGSASANQAPRLQVLFSVDLSHQTARSDFDPGVDAVAVRGNHPALGNWTAPGAVLSRQPTSLVYSAWVPFDVLPQGPVQYKFVIRKEGSPARVVWEERIANRVLRTSGTEVTDAPDDGHAKLRLARPFFDHDALWTPATRIIGADLSGLPMQLALGSVYRSGGVRADPYQLFREHGFTLIRLRLWHSPQGPWCALAQTLRHAQMLRAAGFQLLLDLHYSDTWADPAHQQKPAAWAGLSEAALVDSVYSYTNDVMRAFREAGAAPEYVQIGNEIDHGFLWEAGRVGVLGSPADTSERWARFAKLFRAAAAAVRNVSPETDPPRIIVHAATGGKGSNTRAFFDRLVSHDVDFDVIGLSYYPWWHGTLDDLRWNLRQLANTFGKEIQIVETAYPWTLDGHDATGNFVDGPEDLLPGYDASPQGQLAFLRDLLATLEATPRGLGTAVLYWAPDFVPVQGQIPNPYENLTLFDFGGEALPSIDFGN